MKKYKDKNKAELIDIIDNKNHTIYKLSGQVYYLKNMVKHYKEKINKLKQKQINS